MVLLSKFQKFCIALLALFASLFIFWAMPVNSFTEEYKSHIEDIYGSDDKEVLEAYNELRPSFYNLAFGGEKEAEIFGYEIEMDYDDTPAIGSKFVFFLHLGIIGLTIVALIKDNKKLMKTILVLSLFNGISFMSIMTGMFNNCVLFDSNHITMSFGLIMCLLIYLSSYVVSINSLETEGY